MSDQHDKDPYLSELDAMDDFDNTEHDESQTEIDEPTRIDMKIDMKVPPPPSSDEDLLEESGLPAIEDFSSEGDSPSGLEVAPPIQEILDLTPDLAVPLLVVMGRKSFTVQDLLHLKIGQIMDLDRKPLEPVDLVAAGKVIGRGELVEVDGKIGVRVLKLFK